MKSGRKYRDQGFRKILVKHIQFNSILYNYWYFIERQIPKEIRTEGAKGNWVQSKNKIHFM